MGLSVVCDCGISWSYSLTIVHSFLPIILPLYFPIKEAITNICRRIVIGFHKYPHDLSMNGRAIQGITVFKIFIWGGISSDIRSEI